MADVYMYSGDTSRYVPYVHDYMQGRLYRTLTAGQSYCVTFYTVMSNGATFAINHIGAYLDDGSIDTVSHCTQPHPEFVPQVKAESVIIDSVNWTKVQGSFIANGTERFITIGNLYDDVHTDTIRLYPGFGSYYEVDDISVIASDAVADAGPDVYVDEGSSVYIGLNSNGEGMPCYWYTLGGTTPIDSGGRIAVHPAATTSYRVEMDLCGHVTSDTVVVYVFTTGVAPSGSPLGGVTVWPNPATAEINIGGANGCGVTLYNAVGQAVLHMDAVSGKQAADISGLARGVYVVQVTDAVTGEKVVRQVIKE